MIGGYASLREYLLRTLPPLYVGMMVSDPMVVQSPLSVELAGPTYYRDAMDNQWDGSGISNASPVDIYGIPHGAVTTGTGIFDAPVNGNLLFYVPLLVPLDWPQGGYYHFDAGNLYVR